MSITTDLQSNIVAESWSITLQADCRKSDVTSSGDYVSDTPFIVKAGSATTITFDTAGFTTTFPNTCDHELSFGPDEQVNGVSVITVIYSDRTANVIAMENDDLPTNFDDGSY